VSPSPQLSLGELVGCVVSRILAVSGDALLARGVHNLYFLGCLIDRTDIRCPDFFAGFLIACSADTLTQRIVVRP
jgi:hypothetical protein